MRTPALFALIFFAGGILLAANTDLPALIYPAAAALATALAIVCHLIHRIAASRALIALALFSAGGFLTELQSSELPANHVSNFTSLNAQMTVVGVVSAEPDIRPSKTFLAVEVESLECRGRRIGASGGIRLQIYEPTSAFNYRDRIRFSGYVNRPQEGMNPGAFNYRRYLAIRGITAVISLRSASLVTIVQSGSSEPFVRAIVAPIRSYISSVFDRFLPADQAAVMKGFLIGDVRFIPKEVYERFKDTGTLHVLAASGANVGYVVGVLFLAIRLFRIPRQQGQILLIVGVAIFSFLAYNQPSVVRASVMAVTVLIGRALYRDTNWVNIISFAGLVILMFRPLYIYDLGFQLSFSAAFSLILFMPSFENLVTYRKRIVFEIARYFPMILTGSVIAQLGVMPILIYNFNSVPMVSFISNLLVVPLVAAASMLGIVLVFVSAVPVMSTAIAYLLTLTLSLTLHSVDYFHALPIPQLRVAAPHLLLVVVYYVALQLVFTLAARRKVTGLFVVILLVSLNTLVWKEVIGGQADDVRVTFLDTGGMSTTFVEQRGGQTILVNGGGKSQSFDRGEATVLPFLRSKGVNHLDRILATTAEEGNIQSLLSVLVGLEDNHYDAGIDSEQVQSLTRTIERSERSLLFRIGGVDFAVLTTAVPDLHSLPPKLDIVGVEWGQLGSGEVVKLLDSIQVGTVVVTDYPQRYSRTDRLEELRKRFPRTRIYSVLESGGIVATIGRNGCQVLATTKK